jgi:DNA-binding NarL/FixJ family response regulator
LLICIVTVNVQIKNIYKRLQVLHSKSEAVVKAIKGKWCEVDI